MLLYHDLRLASRAKIAEDAFALSFAVPDELRSEFQFLPGQHLPVRAVVGGKTLRRTYSIVSPQGGELMIGVRQQGQMSRYLTQDLPLNGTLQAMPPNGGFHPRLEPDCAKSYVAIAAGSGITPILSIAASVLSAEPKSRLLLIYANRSMARCMFAEEVLALKNRHMSRFSVHFLLTSEPSDQELLNGRVDSAKLTRFAQHGFDPTQVDEYFLCGPGTMIEDLSSALKSLGAAGKVHVERFGSAARIAESAPEAQREASPKPADVAEVSILMDGRRRSFTMPFSGESLLDAAERAGLELPFSCRSGVCSTCRSKLTAGEVSMQYNQALEDWEVAAGYILCCQARPISRQIELSYDEK